MPPEYQIWTGMKKRCRKPVGNDAIHYAGIKVCERWLTSFDNFYSDMGPRPSPAHSIDRIDFKGNYEPGNCRWATMSQQARNTSRNRILTFNGQLLTLVEWSEKTGISQELIRARI